MTGLRSTVRLAFTALAMGAVGTSSVAQDEVTIRLAHLFTGADVNAGLYDEALDEWEAAHPNVELVREETAGDDHRLKLSTDLAANNTADVFYNWVAPGDLVKFVEAGVLLDVREYLELSETQSEKNWGEASWRGVTVDGVPYALPTTAFKCFTLYNTELFDEHGQVPPTNWDELMAVSAAFNEAGVVPISTGSKGGNPGHLLFNVVLSQLEGGQAAAEAAITSYDVSSEPIRQAAALVNEMKAGGVFPDDTIANGDWNGSMALYNQGRAAMFFTCPWMTGRLDPAIAAVSDVMYFPTVKGAAIEGSEFNVGNINNGWMINRDSFEDPAKQELIVSLMDTLLSEEVRRGMIEGGAFPGWVIGDIAEYDLEPLVAEVHAFTATSPEHFAGFYNFMPTAGSLTAFLEAMDKLFAGDDPAAVIDSFQTTLNREKP